MVGLWPGRSSESSNSEPAAGTSAPGSIEMKGSKWASTPRGQCKVASLRPVASLRSSSSCKQRAKDELVPLAENSNRAAQPGADDAFLEAVMEANLPTMLTCSPRVMTVSPHTRETTTGQEAASSSGRVEAMDNQDYHEVHLVLRVPRTQPGNAATGSLGKTLENLEEELRNKDRMWRRAVDALTIKKQECEDLLGIIRELTQSRNKLTSLKAVQAERLADLQHDFMRQGRVAELSRAVSKENINKTRELTQRLNQVEEELARQKLVSQQAKERYARVKLENLDLHEKICLLERLDVFTYRAESTCMMEFKQIHLKETY